MGALINNMKTKANPGPRPTEQSALGKASPPDRVVRAPPELEQRGELQPLQFEEFDADELSCDTEESARKMDEDAPPEREWV